MKDKQQGSSGEVEEDFTLQNVLDLGGEKVVK